MLPRRMLCALVALCLLLCPVMACAELRVSDEMFDDWYAAMTALVDGIGPRNVGGTGLAQAEAHLLEAFQAAGFTQEQGTLFTVACDVRAHHGLRSIVGIKRARSHTPRIVTVCAHYDSMGGPGARDNASGVASLLTLMRYFAQLPAYEDTELRFIAFTAEEAGHQGSQSYVAQLREDERERSLAVFNIDILVADVWETELAFSVDSMGMRTQDGYVQGTEAAPAHNKAVRALLAAMEETGEFAPEDEGELWCVPRHLGDSDHESFHLAGIDAANVCFRGNVEDGGRWPEFMHTISDVMGDFELERSRQALDVVLTAVDGLSRDHAYGDPD